MALRQQHFLKFPLKNKNLVFISFINFKDLFIYYFPKKGLHFYDALAPFFLNVLSKYFFIKTDNECKYGSKPTKTSGKMTQSTSAERHADIVCDCSVSSSL